jgi:hypothetical protein
MEVTLLPPVELAPALAPMLLLAALLLFPVPAPELVHPPSAKDSAGILRQNGARRTATRRTPVENKRMSRSDFRVRAVKVGVQTLHLPFRFRAV